MCFASGYIYAFREMSLQSPDLKIVSGESYSVEYDKSELGSSCLSDRPSPSTRRPAAQGYTVERSHRKVAYVGPKQTYDL